MPIFLHNSLIFVQIEPYFSYFDHIFFSIMSKLHFSWYFFSSFSLFLATSYIFWPYFSSYFHVIPPTSKSLRKFSFISILLIPHIHKFRLSITLKKKHRRLTSLFFNTGSHSVVWGETREREKRPFSLETRQRSTLFLQLLVSQLLHSEHHGHCCNCVQWKPRWSFKCGRQWYLSPIGLGRRKTLQGWKLPGWSGLFRGGFTSRHWRFSNFVGYLQVKKIILYVEKSV